MGPCHRGMARPFDMDVEDGLQLWRMAANISINSLGQPIWGGPPLHKS